MQMSYLESLQAFFILFYKLTSNIATEQLSNYLCQLNTNAQKREFIINA